MNLVIIQCKEHGDYFTLYPVGYIPYSRSVVVSTDGEGNPNTESQEDTATPEVYAWLTTIFVSALLVGRRDDPVVQKCKDKPDRRTQKRQIIRAALWLALRGSEREMEYASRELGIGILKYREHQEAYRKATTMSGRGKAIVGLLLLITLDQMTLKHMLRVGHQMNLIGRPFWWQKGRYGVVFPEMEHPFIPSG